MPLSNRPSSSSQSSDAVRVREAGGGESFADVTIGVSRLEGLERSH